MADKLELRQKKTIFISPNFLLLVAKILFDFKWSKFGTPYL